MFSRLHQSFSIGVLGTTSVVETLAAVGRTQDEITIQRLDRLESIVDGHVTGVVLDSAAVSPDRDITMTQLPSQADDVPAIVLSSSGDPLPRTLELATTAILPRQAALTEPKQFLSRVAQLIEREQERQVTAVVGEHTSEPISIHDPRSGELLESNQALASLVGSATIDLDRVVAEVDEWSAETLRKRISERAHDAGTIRWPMRKEEKRTWIETSLTIEMIGGRQFVIATSNEVTERSHAEDELAERESERSSSRSIPDPDERSGHDQLVDHIDQIPEGIVVVDPSSGNITTFNQQFAEMGGFSHDDMVGCSIDDVIQMPTTTNGSITDRIRGSESEELVNCDLRRSEGSTIPIEIQWNQTTHRTEQRVVVSVRSGTPQQPRQPEYEQIFHGVNDLIAVRDPDSGTLIDVNQSYAELLGYDREEMIGMSVDDVAASGIEDDDGASTPSTIVDEAMSAEGPIDFEWEIEDADGHRRVMEVTATSASIEGQERYLAIGRDVTERVDRERAVKALATATEGLQNANNPADVAKIAVQGLATVLDLPAVGCWIRGDPQQGESFPLTASTEQADKLGPPKTFEGPLPEAATIEAPGIFAANDDAENFVDWEIHLPVGPYGLLAAGGAKPTAEDSILVEVATTLADHATTALDRLDRERAVRERERRFRLITERIDEVIYLATPDYEEISYVNPAFEDIWRESVETAYEEPQVWIDKIDERDRPEVIADVEIMLEEIQNNRAADTYSSQFRVRWDEETVRWVNSRAYPVTLPSGEQRIIGVIKDVTDQERTALRLREILERIDEAILVARPPDLYDAFLSSGYERIWGQTREEIMATYEDGIYGTIYPEDEAAHREAVSEMVREIEAGTHEDRYRREYRIRRPDGTIRWVESDYYPMEWDDGSTGLVVVSRDITDRKDRERRLTAFDESTADLEAADTKADAARQAATAAVEMLELDGVLIYLYDENRGHLRSQAIAGEIETRSGSPIGPGDNPIWRAFARGERRSSQITDQPLEMIAESVDSWLALPVGNHGVLVAINRETELLADDIEYGQVVAATLEASLNQLRAKRQVEKQEAELETQTERATRLDRLARLVQDVEAAIIEGSTIGGIERGVCERLVTTGPFAGAWIGGVDVGVDRINPRAMVGVDREYLESIDLTIGSDGADRHPAAVAWERSEPVHVNSLVSEAATAEWRSRALGAGHQSLCAVPIVQNEVTGGVLCLAAEEPNAFDERTREVIAQLGLSIGNAILAIERRRALESDETIELEFTGTDVSLPFSRAATQLECTVSHAGTVPTRAGNVRVAFEIDCSPEAVPEQVRQEFQGDIELKRDPTGGSLLEVTTDEWFGSTIAAHGGVIREATAEAGDTRLVIELPAQADVRAFTQRLEESASGLELAAKRHRGQQSGVGRIDGAPLTDDLTERQQEVLQTALEAGYFEWPRESDGEDVADRLGITQPTFNKHLRVAERKIFQQLYSEIEE